METRPYEPTDGTLHSLARRCSHCFRPIAADSAGPLRAVYCDEHCARADLALWRRLTEASEPGIRLSPNPSQVAEETPAPGAGTLVAWLAPQLIGVLVPIVALLYLLRRYL